MILSEEFGQLYPQGQKQKQHPEEKQYKNHYQGYLLHSNRLLLLLMSKVAFMNVDPKSRPKRFA